MYEDYYKKINSDNENNRMPVRVGYILFLLSVILFYGFIIFFYDNLLPLLKWIPYRFLEIITPNIFIPNLGDNGSYEKTIILGLMTFICTLIIPLHSCISFLKIIIKYNGNPHDNRTMNVIKGIIGGDLNKTSHLIISIIGALLMIISVLIVSRTNAFAEETQMMVLGFYCLLLVLLVALGVDFSWIIYKFFIDKNFNVKQQA